MYVGISCIWTYSMDLCTMQIGNKSKASKSKASKVESKQVKGKQAKGN
jgi:hypothetical protein